MLTINTYNFHVSVQPPAAVRTEYSAPPLAVDSSDVCLFFVGGSKSTGHPFLWKVTRVVQTMFL